MDQARTTISKIFNGEPRSYTRFSLTQNMEGGDSQVEMKLAPEAEEEPVGTNGVGEHLNHNSNVSYKRKTSSMPKNICFLLAATLLLFIIGYLIGYLVHRKQDKAGPACQQTDGGMVLPGDEDPSPMDTSAPKQMDWGEVKHMLRDRLTTEQIEDTLSEFSIDSHQAGSPGDEMLANRVLKRFQQYNMQTWNDEHYVKLQAPPTSLSNSVTFRGKSLGPLQGYLAYSASNTVEGSVMYAHYGRKEDFEDLNDMSINLTGKIILMRAGKISLAEKVANAENMNAIGVLIYPDPADYALPDSTHLFGHVHFGSGDPFTPAFPSFNHTQFPPARSSGLPGIVAQTITASMAQTIMSSMEGRKLPRGWIDGGLPNALGGPNDVATVQVNNKVVETRIHNVFGVIKGVIDPDRYVVIGAQRDAWGPGFAKSTVGTTLLVELAKAISGMVRQGRFMPRRSLVFASWSAGEYGGVGATEWLEGYLPSLNMKAYSYICLDGVVTGSSGFKASASPLMHGILSGTLKEVESMNDPGKTIYMQVSGSNWESSVLEPLEMSNPTYPFIAFSGIPSMSFRITGNQAKEYPFFGTMLDTREKLDSATFSNVPKMTRVAGLVAGQVALRLVHDHLLQLSVEKYDQIIRSHVSKVLGKVNTLQKAGRLPSTFTPKWLIAASGSYGRGARGLIDAIENSDLEDMEQCRMLNDRLMRVDANLLSPYLSPRDTPFRHILLGSGAHTLPSLVSQLDSLMGSTASSDTDALMNQFALTSWTIQACANALAGDVWDMNNNI